MASRKRAHRTPDARADDKPAWWREHIVSLIGAGVLAVAGWIGVQVYSIRTQQSADSTNIKNLQERVDRIAGVLPDIKARVAWEELNAPLAGFYAVSNPITTPTGSQFTELAVYDASTGVLKKWQVPFEERAQSLQLAVVGKLRANSADMVSFSELAQFSAAEKEESQIPNAIDRSTSYLIRTGDVQRYADYLQKLVDAAPDVRAGAPSNNWKEARTTLELLGPSQDSNRGEKAIDNATKPEKTDAGATMQPVPESPRA